MHSRVGALWVVVAVVVCAGAVAAFEANPWAGAADDGEVKFVIEPVNEEFEGRFEVRKHEKRFKKDKYWYPGPGEPVAVGMDNPDAVHQTMIQLDHAVRGYGNPDDIEIGRKAVYGKVDPEMLGQMLLWHAVHQGHRDLVDYLLTWKDDTIDVDKDNGGRNMIHVATQFGFCDIVKHLIDAGVDMDVENQFGQLQMSPLEVALVNTFDGPLNMNLAPRHPKEMLNFKCIVDALLKYDVEIGFRTVNYAITGRNVDNFKKVVEKSGWDCNTHMNHLLRGCLHEAVDSMTIITQVSKIMTGHPNFGWWARNGGEEAMRKYKGPVYKAVREINLPWNETTWSDTFTPDNKATIPGPFRDMIFKWNQPLVEYILTMDIDINLPDINGLTPLHIAASFGDYRSCEAILKAGATVEPLDNDGVTPLEHAAFSSHVRAMEVLLKYGADRSRLDKYTFYGDNNTVNINCHADEATGGERCDEVRIHTRYSDGTRANRKNTLQSPPDAVANGGWADYVKTDVLIDYCDVDVRTDLTEETFLNEYFIPRKPVVIPGFVKDRWPAMTKWTKDYFKEEVKDLEIKTFDNKPGMLIPVSSSMTFSQYVDYLDQKSGTDAYPTWAVDYSTPEVLWKEDCTGFIDWIEPALRKRGDAFPKIPQFMIAPAYMGASPHFHNTAGNVVMFGKKRWLLWPPERSFYSTVHIHDFVNNVLPNMTAEAQPLQCIQNAGDMIFVPRMWGHGVIYPMETIGLAFLFES